MPHPVHAILKRLLDIEQFAFDATPGEFWPSERFVPDGRESQGRSEPRRRDGLYLERESQS